MGKADSQVIFFFIIIKLKIIIYFYCIDNNGCFSFQKSILKII